MHYISFIAMKFNAKFHYCNIQLLFRYFSSSHTDYRETNRVADYITCRFSSSHLNPNSMVITYHSTTLQEYKLVIYESKSDCNYFSFDNNMKKSKGVDLSNNLAIGTITRVDRKRFLTPTLMHVRHFIYSYNYEI